MDTEYTPFISWKATALHLFVESTCHPREIVIAVFRLYRISMDAYGSFLRTEHVVGRTDLIWLLFNQAITDMHILRFDWKVRRTSSSELSGKIKTGGYDEGVERWSLHGIDIYNGTPLAKYWEITVIFTRWETVTRLLHVVGGKIEETGNVYQGHTWN